MKYWRSWHRWLGLIIGLQVLLWISGGVVMSVIPIEWVRGQHLITKPELNAELIRQYQGKPLAIQQLKQARWLMRGSEPIISVIDFTGKRQFLAANNHQSLTQLTNEQAGRLAVSQYQGSGQLVDVSLISQVPAEVSRLTAPLYQITFDDSINTTFYMQPISGQVLSVRSDLWRFYDFFWMLHIMDYQTRSDFNNPLVIAAACSALLFTFSGLVLLYFSLIKPKTIKFLRKKFNS